LRTLFKQFGDVLDVVAHQNIRMRGQAFVAFPDEVSAAKAIKDLQHFVLYDKPMVLQFAHNKSDVHAKTDGDFETHHKQRMAKKGRCAIKSIDRGILNSGSNYFYFKQRKYLNYLFLDLTNQPSMQANLKIVNIFVTV
jgi:RNA recognition motif-containing protein